MARIQDFSKYVLLGLVFWGFFAAWGFSAKNGLFPLLEKLPEAGVLPGTLQPLRTVYTGLKPIDAQLSILVSFFWPMIDGSSPSVSLGSLEFLGQGAAAWVVCVVEGARSGNKGRLVSWVTLMGLSVQNISFAVTIPAYLALHLFTSPTASGADTRSIIVRFGALKWLPLSLILGYYVPTILMTLPAPSIITFEQKQIFAALFQPFPVLVTTVAWTFEILFGSGQLEGVSEQRQRAAYRKELRNVYAIGFVLAIVSHLAAWTLSITAAVLPNVFTPPYADAFHPARVFLNTSPFSNVKISSLEEGVLWFLQWDLTTGAGALLVWSTTLYMNAFQAKHNDTEWISSLVLIIILTALSGPCGAALMMVWRRDELLLEDSNSDKKVA